MFDGLEKKIEKIIYTTAEKSKQESLFRSNVKSDGSTRRNLKTAATKHVKEQHNYGVDEKNLHCTILS